MNTNPPNPGDYPFTAEGDDQYAYDLSIWRAKQPRQPSPPPPKWVGLKNWLKRIWYGDQ